MSIIALASAVYSLMCCSLIPGGLSILPSALASPQMMLTALAQHLCAFVHMTCCASACRLGKHCTEGRHVFAKSVLIVK